MPDTEEWPTPREISEIRRWCKGHRGSVSAIAARVIRHDGGIGVQHSAVSRTLRGHERNRGVITAYKKVRRSVERTANHAEE